MGNMVIEFCPRKEEHCLRERERERERESTLAFKWY